MENIAGIATVGLYAAANALILTWLSFRIGGLRHSLKISIGDGGHPIMIRAMRGQANFTENVPMALILLVLMALLGTPVWVLHIFGIMLVLGRILHGIHFLSEDAPGWQRALGALSTIAVQVLAALGLVGHGLFILMAG